MENELKKRKNGQSCGSSFETKRKTSFGKGGEKLDSVKKEHTVAEDDYKAVANKFDTYL